VCTMHGVVQWVMCSEWCTMLDGVMCSEWCTLSNGLMWSHEKEEKLAEGSKVQYICGLLSCVRCSVLFSLLEDFTFIEYCSGSFTSSGLTFLCHVRAELNGDFIKVTHVAQKPGDW
jgi:hypothetical protein